MASTAADMGISSPDLEVNLEEEYLREAKLLQGDPSFSDMKPPADSTDVEIISFLETRQADAGKDVNRGRAEQDQSGPKAPRSYVTTVPMTADLDWDLGYWKEKEVKAVAVHDGEFRRVIGLKRTFHGTEMNKYWFMHEYIPTGICDKGLYLESLRFRVLEYNKDGAPVPGEATSPGVNNIPAMKLRMLEQVVNGPRSPVWQHFLKIYDRHPELQMSKAVYALCCYCERGFKADPKNGTSSLKRHTRACQRKHLQPSSPTLPSCDLGSAPSSPISCSQWEKGKYIGGGRYGQVYLGVNSENGQFCAIKEVLIISNDPHSKEQLSKEIYFLKQFSHPNIVQYYGSTMTDRALSIYMEYVSKGSIHKLLANDGPFEESMIRSYTAQILSGLAYLHERKHIHRDIKGANILVGPNNEVKLADFGLAKHIATLTEVHTSNRGSTCWMAPEVILSNYSGKGYNLSADIWSLGCTVIEMATGKPPLHGYEQVAAVFKIANDDKYTPEIPDVLSDEGKSFLRLCLQRDPKSRPSAAELMHHPFIHQGI